MQIPFLGPTYQGRSVNIDASRCVNLIPEITQIVDKSQIQLVGTPGIQGFFAGPSADVVRGVYTFNDKMYAVIGDSFYEIDTSGTATLIDTIGTSSGRVSFADNGLAQNGVGGNQLMIVDGDSGYIYDVTAPTPTFTEIASAGGWTDLLTGGGPTQVVYIDGYFVAVNGTMSYWVSDLYDGTTWNALATASVVASSENIVGVAVHRQQLFFMKSSTTEVWYNAGTPTSSGSPFQRVSGAVFDYGCAAPWSIAKGSNSIYFLATQRQNNIGELVGIAEVTEYQPTIITPPPLNWKLGQMTDHGECFGYCYSDEGHSFYMFTNPTDDFTLCYDSTTKLWHERSSFASDFLTVKRHVSNCYTFFNNKHYVGDYRSANIYEMDTAFLSDNGLSIYSWRSSQHIFDKDKLEDVFINMLAVDFETGVGSNTESIAIANVFPAGFDGTNDVLILADGSTTAGAVLNSAVNPVVYLSWSLDGGHTWSTEYPKSLGTENAYTTRVRWRRLGRSDNRVFKIGVRDPVKRVMIGAYVEAGR